MLHRYRNKLSGPLLDRIDLHTNSQVQPWDIHMFCKLNEKGDVLPDQTTDKLSLSACRFTRRLKLARTIDDLARVEQIEVLHLSETIQYQGQDQKLGQN